MDDKAPATATNGNSPAEPTEVGLAARLPRARTAQWRETRASRAMTSALRKQTAGVPTYTVHEAAALLSISPEHLYRLIRADAFPALRMRSSAEHGRYVIPARAVEQMLNEATEAGTAIDLVDPLR